MKKVIRIAYSILFLLFFIHVGNSQFYNPQLNIITDPTTILANGFVEYETTNANIGDLRFTLFGDGYFTTLDDFDHQFQPNSGGYTTTTYFNRRYKKHVPTVRTKTIQGTGSGNSNNSKISMPPGINTRVATSWQPSFGFENYYMVIFENTTTVTESGCIEFYYDDSDLMLDMNGILEYGWVLNRVISNVTAPGPYNKKIKWDFVNLSPGEQRVVYLPMVTTAGIGSLINVGSKYLSGCVNSPGSIFNSRFVSNGSPHDPNSKTANKDCVRNYVNNAQPIIYTVKFQNEGDGAAKNVILFDVLDDNLLDLTTLEILDAEYDYEYFLEGNQLTIKFDNIYLPGLKQKGKNIYTYEQTESYVQFQICTREILEPGVIENQVEIYFDDQPAILTNLSEVFIVSDCVNEICESEEKITNTTASVNSKITINPNPIENNIYVDGLEDHIISIDIYNNRGELVRSYSDIDKRKNHINMENLPSGLYLIQVRNEMLNFTKKMLKL